MKSITLIQHRLTDAFRKFTSSQKISGILLLIVSVVSLILANSGFSSSYIHFWESPIYHNGDVHISLLHFINDGLMTIFFLLVGLEIKRELIAGELKGFQRASIPVAAAIGGMLVPAVLYSLFNSGLDSASGWGIPMATDIAFAIGIISILGKRVSDAGKILITAIAVVDDLGAVIVIALFYSASISIFYLALAGLTTVLLSYFNYIHYLNLLVLYITILLLLYISINSSTVLSFSGTVFFSRVYTLPLQV